MLSGRNVWPQRNRGWQRGENRSWRRWNPPLGIDRSTCQPPEGIFRPRATSGLLSAVAAGSAWSVPVRSPEPSARSDVIHAESEIPPNTQNDDLRFEMPSLEQSWPVLSHAGQAYQTGRNTVCNTAPWGATHEYTCKSSLHSARRIISRTSRRTRDCRRTHYNG
jgi:hypothetical protein